MKTSFDDGWSVRPKVNKFLELAGPGAAWEPVTLPHDAMIGSPRSPEHPGLNAFFGAGVWEYTKTFAVPAEWADRRVHLQFEGVYRDATVYVNDDFAGSEPYGYSEFVVDLDPFIRPGADNTIRVECRTGDDARWYSGAGIYRPVHLWVQRPVRLALDGVWITTPEVDAEGAVVQISCDVVNDSPRTSTVRVRCDVRDESGVAVATGSVPVTLPPRSSTAARQRLYVANPRRWGPDAPHLYTCSTTIDGEEPEETSFGIRSLRLDSRHGLRINDESVKLRGACVHHDNGPIGAATIDRAEERRVEILKAAGFNAIRSAHNPTSRALLSACDRLGVLVMDECWDIWTEPKRDHDHSLRFPTRWRDDVASMVRKDRNHPSVVLYSTGNEISEVGSPLGAARGRAIAEHIRSLDPHRYVTNAVQPLLAIRDLIGTISGNVTAEEMTSIISPDQPAGVNSQMASWAAIKDVFLGKPVVGDVIEEICAGVDVGGYNYMDARYLVDSEAFPDRPIVGSETYMTAIGRNWPTITAHPHLLGDFTWTGWEYLGEVGIGRTEYQDEHRCDPSTTVNGGFPWLVSGTGDIDITGHRRTQSLFREVVFGLTTRPAIAVRRPGTIGHQVVYSGPWTWSDTVSSWSWDGWEGTTLPVEVYSTADEVELVLNGEPVGRRPAGPAHGFRAAFDVPYASGELVAVAFVAGEESGRCNLRSATGPRRVRMSADRATIRADHRDLGYIDIDIVDATGVVDVQAAVALSIAIEGPAVLQGFASADPVACEPFSTTSCRTFDGRALAVVRPTGPGPIVVTITSDGFDPVVGRVEAVTAP